MKKRVLSIFLMTIMLVLSAGTISTQAAAGWNMADGKWVYYSDDGPRVTNEWKKGADDLWRYLNSSGEMAINSWVEGTYHVDGDGILTTDKWVKLENPAWNKVTDSGQYKWYYFGSSGKAITDTWKKIDGKWYYFGADGAMLTGWILDDMYYAGTDGVMRTGWQKLEPPREDHEENRVTPESELNDGKAWYYFSAGGKKFVPDLNGAEYGERKIDGVYYCFNENGAMQTGWRNIKTDSESGSIGDYKYFKNDGKAHVGWLSLEPPEALSTQYSYSVEWFYFNSNGFPEVGKRGGEKRTTDLKKINGYTYLFNELGTPAYGLQKVYTGNSEDNYTAYYFGDLKSSTMLKGKRKVTEGDGTQTEFYFVDSGRGYTGVRDSTLYYMGKPQKAEEGSKYQAFTIAGNHYVVNTSGKLAKSVKVKNFDGVEYKTGPNGNLIQVDGQAPGKGPYHSPVEPVWFD